MIDYFKTRVYYAEKKNRFLTVKWRVEAGKTDFVVVGIIFKTGEIIIQPYRGQAHLGVVCELRQYQMPGAAQLNPETMRLRPS